LLQALQPGGHRLGTLVIEAHTVDERLVFGQPKQPGPVVAWLGQRRDRPDLHVSKAQRRPGPHRDGVFVEACGQPDGIGKPQAKGGDLEALVLHCTELPHQFQPWSQGPQPGQAVHHPVVNGLGVLAEQPGFE